jgi:hypothetical protein
MKRLGKLPRQVLGLTQIKYKGSFIKHVEHKLVVRHYIHKRNSLGNDGTTRTIMVNVGESRGRGLKTAAQSGHTHARLRASCTVHKPIGPVFRLSKGSTEL